MNKDYHSKINLLASEKLFTTSQLIISNAVRFFTTVVKSGKPSVKVLSYACFKISGQFKSLNIQVLLTLTTLFLEVFKDC